jgi:hypothetical protein
MQCGEFDHHKCQITSILKKLCTLVVTFEKENIMIPLNFVNEKDKQLMMSIKLVG